MTVLQPLATDPRRAEPAAAAAAVTPITVTYGREALQRRRHAAAEFLAWADAHQQQERLHSAKLAQITRHPEGAPERDAIGQQRAWARRQARRQHLHDSAMAQLRHR